MSVRHLNWSFQHSADNMEQFFISDIQRPQLPYQLRVIYIVEEPFYVKLYHIVKS